MTALTKNYEGSICEIKSEQNDLLTAGIIRFIGEDEMEVVDSSGEKMLIVPYGKTVKISVMNGKLGFLMLMGEVYLSTEHFLRLVNIETMQNFERRIFFRVNVKITALMFPYVEGQTEEEMDAESESERALKIKVENVSLSGLLFNTERKFHLGDVFEVELILFKDIMRVKCEVCRLDSPENGRNRYGCQFLDCPQRQIDLLCRDLFQLQRIQLQKRRAGTM